MNEDPRPLADGDHAVISLESISGTDEKVSQDELVLKIGDEATMPVLRCLRGVSPEKARFQKSLIRRIAITKNLAGRTVKFRAQVKAVRRNELPEVNDEFAKDLGDFQTLEELKNTVRTRRSCASASIGPGRRQAPVAGQAGGRARVPGAGRLYRPADSSERGEPIPRAGGAGRGPGDLKLDWQKAARFAKDRATRDVKASLILDKIGEREAVAPTQEEVDREVQRVARQAREAVAITRAKLQKDGVIGRIAATSGPRRP